MNFSVDEYLTILYEGIDLSKDYKAKKQYDKDVFLFHVILVPFFIHRGCTATITHQ